MDSFARLLRDARTCRRFDGTKPVSPADLRQIVDDVRITSSCANKQPLRYYTVSAPAVCARIFPHTKWAAALSDWGGPAEGERPTGYIVICSAQPAGMFVYYDVGIAAQSMQLDATDKGFACCMINNFSRDHVREILRIPTELEIMLVLAFGAPTEVRRLEDAKIGDKLQYWRDDAGVHHVPKLTLDQVLLGEE